MLNLFIGCMVTTQSQTYVIIYFLLVSYKVLSPVSVWDKLTVIIHGGVKRNDRINYYKTFNHIKIIYLQTFTSI